MKAFLKHVHLAACAFASALGAAPCLGQSVLPPVSYEPTPSRLTIEALNLTATPSAAFGGDDGIRIPVSLPSISTAFPLVPAASPSDIALAPTPMEQNRVLTAHVDTLRLQERQPHPQSRAPEGDGFENARADAYSPNWLLDGVRRLEAEARKRDRAQSRGTDARDDTGQLSARDAPDERGARRNAQSRDIFQRKHGKSSDASARLDFSENPLAVYLDKWISTPDAASAAMRGMTAVTPDGAPAAYDREPAAGVFSGATSIQPLAEPRALSSSADFSPANNPFVGDPSQPMFNTWSSGAGVSPMPEATPAQGFNAGNIQGAPSAMPAAAAASDATFDASPGPAVQSLTRPASGQVPTKPIVNDQKYFPQFNRF